MSERRYWFYSPVAVTSNASNSLFTDIVGENAAAADPVGWGMPNATYWTVDPSAPGLIFNDSNYP
jgi:hypothetical protein